LKAATNLNVVQPKLFQASRQDDLRFSDCTVSVIQILDDTDAAFRISGAELRTVLSATTMLADKPHRFNGRTSVQRVYVLTILPPVTHSRLGYPRSGLSRSDFVLWRKAVVRLLGPTFDRTFAFAHRRNTFATRRA
jgi:hypothetical protein